MRNPHLDILRGVAILMVLAHHFDLLPGGWAGVDLFFVLSGFLISGLLFDQYQRTGGMNIQRFYIRRAFKLYPALYVFLLVSGLLSASAVDWPAALATALFTQNYFTGLRPEAWGPTWSLAVEEHFYIALPLLLWWLAKSGFRRLPLVFGIVAAGSLALRIGTALSLSADAPSMLWYTPTHLRIDSLLCGVFLQYLRTFQPARFQKLAKHPFLPLPLLAAVLLLGAVPLDSPVMHTIGFTVLYLGFGSMLAMVEGGGPARFLQPLARLGEYSYSIYLWHKLFAMLIPHSGFPAFALYLVLSIVWGVLMAKAVEIPALALRDRWFPARSTVSYRQYASRRSDHTGIPSCV